MIQLLCCQCLISLGKFLGLVLFLFLIFSLTSLILFECTRHIKRNEALTHFLDWFTFTLSLGGVLTMLYDTNVAVTGFSSEELKEWANNAGIFMIGLSYMCYYCRWYLELFEKVGITKVLKLVTAVIILSGFVISSFLFYINLTSAYLLTFAMGSAAITGYIYIRYRSE